MSKHQAKEVRNARGKKKVWKQCMNCPRVFRDWPSGVVNPLKMERGVCDKCQENDAIWHYHPEDYGVLHNTSMNNVESSTKGG